MENNINNDDNNGNNGNKGKFSDRLKKIRRDRLLLKKRHNFKVHKKDNIIKRSSRNVFKILLALPSIVYTSIKTDKIVKDNLSKKENVVPKNEGKVIENKPGYKSLNDNGKFQEITSLDSKLQEYKTKKEFFQEKKIQEETEQKKIKVNKIKDMDVSLLKKKREMYLQVQDKQYKNKVKETNDVQHNAPYLDDFNNNTKHIVNNENDLRIAKLQKEIIDLIKKKLVKNINELEILQSELYLLKELTGGDTYLKKCQEDIKEVKKLLSKIKALKEKYDYLKENVDFDYMLEYGDDLLIDKILELKSLCSRDDIKYTIDNYKILDEYKFLYLKIDKLQEDTIKYEEYKNNKVEELKQRDIDFEKFKNDAYNIDRNKEMYDNFVIEQNRFLDELNSKASHIDSRENVTYHLKGFNQMLGHSFKYLGLLLLSPLKGLIPGIATQTVVTKNIVSNLYNNLEWQENRKIVYEAVDYSAEISNAINDLDFTSSMIDSTLEDIIRLKAKYKNDFSKYEYSFSKYSDVIKKLNKMENAVLGSKIKIEMMRQRMKEKELQNDNKLKMVKKLNSSSDS